MKRQRPGAVPGLCRCESSDQRAAMARGLMVYPMGGTVDGCYGDHVLLAPPFITSESELAQIVERLDAAIRAALSSP